MIIDDKGFYWRAVGTRRALGSEIPQIEVFEDLVVDEEGHYDQYDVELDNLTKFGERYLALQPIERSKNRQMGVAE